MTQNIIKIKACKGNHNSIEAAVVIPFALLCTGQGLWAWAFGSLSEWLGLTISATGYTDLEFELLPLAFPHGEHISNHKNGCSTFHHVPKSSKSSTFQHVPKSFKELQGVPRVPIRSKEFKLQTSATTCQPVHRSASSDDAFIQNFSQKKTRMNTF